MKERADELFESGKVALAEGNIADALKHLSMSLSFFSASGGLHIQSSGRDQTRRPQKGPVRSRLRTEGL